MSIKILRQSANLTQEALAEKLGVKRSAVAMWERGDAMPRAATLKKLAEVLDCTIDELVGR